MMLAESAEEIRKVSCEVRDEKILSQMATVHDHTQMAPGTLLLISKAIFVQTYPKHDHPQQSL
jgi:hypothetical protein